MRRLLFAALTAAALATAAVPTVALADNSQRPGGSITTPEGPPPANGGDQGWGNCGHNSSGGHPHTGDNGKAGGNGGDRKSLCGDDVPTPTPAPTPTPTVTPTPTPTDGGGGPNIT